MADSYPAWRKAVEDGERPASAPTRDVVYKEFDVAVEPVADGRLVKFTITTSTPDRERDVVDAEGVDIAAFLMNPVVLFAHDYRSLPIARAVYIDRTSSAIVATTEFATADLNPLAEQVYRLVKAGFLRAASIGFRPLEWAYNEERKGVDFHRVELLEFSIVPVPANAQALIAARAAGIDTAVLKDWAKRVLATSDGLATGERIRRNIESLGEPFYGVTEEWDVLAETTRPGLDTARTYARRRNAIRWNPQLSKSFDVTGQEYPARDAEQALAAKYCGCAVKSLYWRAERIWSARLGAFLTALDETLRTATIDDLRNITSNGAEEPPLYERLQLNSTQSREFLIDGIRFLQWNNIKVCVRVSPRWYGLEATLYASRQHTGAAEAFLGTVLQRAGELNFLKGEAFSLSGEFLTRGHETFDDLFLDGKNAKAIQRIVTLLQDKGAALENRGALLLGPPGTGKTLSGRILMNQASATFIWVSSRDFYYAGVFGGLVDAFDLARACAPTVLFVEDVDNWLTPTTVDMVKTEMDGIAQSTGVVTILTTNYPELLPKALIDRPGRFHDVLRFDLPDEGLRHKMLAKWLPALPEADATAAVKATAGYSGAHMRELARFAGIIAEQDHLDLGTAMTQALAKLAEQRDLITAVQTSGSRYRAPDLIVEKSMPTGAAVEKGVSPKDVSTDKADESAAWSAPSLADFTDSGWGDLSDAERRRIAGHYAWAASMPPAAFGDLKLPHHEPKSGNVVWRGVVAAIARLNQADVPSADLGSVKAHLRRHYKAFRPDAEPPDALKSLAPFDRDEVGWSAYVKARDRVLRKGNVTDAALADLLADYGFDEEAAVLKAEMPDTMEPDADGNCPDGYMMGDDQMCHVKAKKPDANGTCPAGMEMGDDGMCHMPMKAGAVLIIRGITGELLAELVAGQKSGRVLSKANEHTLREAHGAIMHAGEQIAIVLRTVEEEDRADGDAAAVEAAAVPGTVLALDDDDTVVLELEPETKADAELLEIDAADLTSAIRGALTDVVRLEARAAVNALRGRID